MIKEYVVFVIWCFYIVVAVVYSIVYSSTTKFNGTIEFPLLSWTIDFLDPEWRVLYQYLQALLIYLLFYFFCRQLFRFERMLFYILSGIIFGGYLSRFGFAINLILMLANYIFVKLCKSSAQFLKIHWIIHLIIVYLINIFNGLNNIWGQNGKEFNQAAPIPWQHIYFWNMLRMTSYNIEVQEIKLVEYIAYLLYPPLYYSGPLIQFTDWQTQIRINQTVNKKHKYIISGIILLALQILTQCYAITNHQENEWLWEKQISTLSGISFFVTSTVQIYFKFIFLWSLQECWASYDNIEVNTNNPKHMFMINSASTFEKYFCASYNNFFVKYLKDNFSQNSYLNLLLIYSITIILLNSDVKTIWFFVTLFLFHLFEEKISIQSRFLNILIRSFQQCIILLEIIIIYTSDINIIWIFVKHKNLFWIPIIIGTCILTQMYLSLTKQIL